MIFQHHHGLGQRGRVVGPVLVLVAVLALTGALALWRLRPQATVEAKTSSSSRPNSSNSTQTQQPSNHEPAPAVHSVPTPAKSPTQSSTKESTPHARELVSKLTQIDVTHGPLTPEQATAWKETLKQLIGQGTAAVPAIREFLKKNIDLDFDQAGFSTATGVSSLRLAMLDALQQIGGPEAIATLDQTLQTTADPAELATLAKFLESSEPEKHRTAVLTAAREALAMAASDQWDGRDVSPLFEILKTYGGAQAAADLEPYANTWFDYTPVTLAELPDGAGIATLIELAQNADGKVKVGRDIYQRMLAQVAVQYPSAADALVKQTRADQIGMGAWPGVGAALIGATLRLAKPLLEPSATPPNTRLFHVVLGNQNYIEVPPSPGLTANDLGDRVRLIDKLLGVTSNPVAIDALEAARVTLSARLAALK